MRILSVTAQKPDSTGSGVYLSELVKNFEALGHEQAVIAGVYKEDSILLPENVKVYPLYFKSEEVPFAIAGMSDEMPYESTVYGQMTPEMVDVFENAFKNRIKSAVEEFAPGIIVCHHLYLLTSLVREMYPEKLVFGFCHNTDLRQMKKIALRREFIKSQVPKLDGIFALHDEQKKEICQIYDVDEAKIKVVGAGYNQTVFHRLDDIGKDTDKYRFIFAGKISEKKGVMSLIRSLDYLPWNREQAEFILAGGYGNPEEYNAIMEIAQNAPYEVRFAGKLTQDELAKEYNKSHVFILPSFSEGMPLTMIEAMSCGCKVVITDLPGIKPWVEERIDTPPVFFVTPPEMVNADEPIPESLEIFEKELAEKIVVCAEYEMECQPDLRKISWQNICEEVINKACIDNKSVYNL